MGVCLYLIPWITGYETLHFQDAQKQNLQAKKRLTKKSNIMILTSDLFVFICNMALL